ncbi:uncharacterized protein LAJ45_04233 [Morchella importuna]|uniref:uncharacterized protein n=1 Tax=Morchella importuna TaxID=1174673 RepID=UPI001E8E109D|nr:uncharacterized protein LAJ45_04233 [Morchella importuna]KAH8151611.1 hypothetical protein LAJ45_04233 [Morchella importuna]
MASTSAINPAEGVGIHANDEYQQSTLRKNSVNSSGSKKPRSGSVGEPESRNSVFYTPIPTQTNPTETLSNRFSAWRKVLKDFINYFREVQASYENRAKGVTKISQTLNTTIQPSDFIKSGGILETNNVLREFQKDLYVSNDNATKTLASIINNLNSLRTDLNFKIKEIKALSPDFKNNVDKEKENTRKEIIKLTEALTALDSNPQNASGKTDPYLVKLGLQRQLKRQIDEENYLHKAYINIETSGRELERIIVVEIQKSFETYIKLIKLEGEGQDDFAQRLTTSTLQLPADHEWSAFVERDSGIGGSSVPLRTVNDIEYPGHQHPAALEVRSGLMERKSKYLKSYTPGWFVLSSTHLHEFKVSDRTSDPDPVMSLYLPEASLGKHSEPGATSHKFILKARQTGVLHMGHNWVFRAESHEAMLAWYADIKRLTEVSGAERNAFVTGVVHGRHESIDTTNPEETSDDIGLDNDEADEIPYSTDASALAIPAVQENKRPEGGRFPSDLNVNRGAASLTGESDRSIIGAAGALSGSYGEQPLGRPRSGSQSSTWSYDEKHPVHNTMDEEADEFLPVGAEIPPAVERRMSVRHDYTDHEALAKSQSSANRRRGPPSRKPTASYGIDPTTGLPDTGMGGPSSTQLSREGPPLKVKIRSSFHELFAGS